MTLLLLFFICLTAADSPQFSFTLFNSETLLRSPLLFSSFTFGWKTVINNQRQSRLCVQYGVRFKLKTTNVHSLVTPLGTCIQCMRCYQGRSERWRSTGHELISPSDISVKANIIVVNIELMAELVFWILLHCISKVVTAQLAWLKVVTVSDYVCSTLAGKTTPGWFERCDFICFHR